MKKLFFTISLLFCLFNVNAQDFNRLLGMPVDSTIEVENYFISTSNKGMSKELISVKSFPQGGFKMTYQNRYYYDNDYHYSFDVCYFDTRDKLVCYDIVTSARLEMEQTNSLLKGDYYKISENVLYHKL